MLEILGIKIVKGFPPNIEQIKKFFKIDHFQEGIAFAYGDTIYSIGKIEEDLIRHESVHIKQQKKIGGAEIWWKRYIEDPKFRLDQEVPAYRVQYHAWRMANEKKYHKMALEQLAKHLSGPIYGHMIDYKNAYKIIAEEL